MPSSKGKPTDPKLREQAKKEVMGMEKGGGKGQWSAWKAAEMSKVYEKKGGGYEDTGDNPNKAKKGAPAPKKKAVESGERKAADAPVGEPKKAKAAPKKAVAAKKTKSTTSSTKSTAKKPAASGSRAQPKRGSKASK